MCTVAACNACQRRCLMWQAAFKAHSGIGGKPVVQTISVMRSRQCGTVQL